MAKVKAEFLQAYYEGRSRPLGHWLMARIHEFNRYGSRLAPLVNLVQWLWPTRWLLEKSAGIDRRRSLPRLRSRNFRRWFARGRARNAKLSGLRVVLLDDCFTTFNEPKIGKSAVRVLEAAGFSVELAGLTCCGRTLISKGFLKEARALVQAQAPALAQRLADGTPLLGIEPSCLLTLADEWRELVPGPDTQRIAAASELADGWLARQSATGQTRLELRPRSETCVLHGHCHQKALVGVNGTASALRMIPNLGVTVLDAGCCGMAGSFGFEKEHYDLSVRIANLALLPALADAPEAMVVAPGTSCRHQIRDLAKRRALHPLEVLAEQLQDS
jgi:Fe-S oxidoreductase